MAEFKLGRIRFIWKNNWTSGTVYYKDDIIRNGGNTYVCIKGHTAPALFSTSQSTYWNKISDGQEWKSDWTTSTLYKINDIVKYGGYLYVANQEHTSANTATLGLENDQSKWDLYAEGFDYKTSWVTNTRYKINDIVKYNGTEFICTSGHTSAATDAEGLEVNDGKILTVNNFSAADASRTVNTYTGLKPTGGTGKGAEVTAVVAVGGAVSLTVTGGGTQYLVGQTLTLTDAQLGGGGGANFTFQVATTDERWDIFSEGFFWKSNWSISTRYLVNDLVRYGGQLYVCNEGHTSASTASSGLENDQSKWDYVNKGIEYKVDWSTGTRYKINDIVKYGGGTWICTTYHTSQATFAADEAKWSQFVEGLEFEDSWSGTTTYQPGDFVTYGGYSYVSKTNNVGNGAPSTNTTDWDLFTTGFRHAQDWGDDSSAEEYKVGDVVRLGGITYLCIQDHTGQRPPNNTYWELLNEGFKWKNTWASATLYDKGDSIKYGVNSYVCVLAHTSDTPKRPDNDASGTYWNALIAGAESGNLTTQGDLVYYSGAGPTRLPIGDAGQILKVNSAGNAPEWAYFGALNNVYYVQGVTGVDSAAPSYGTTLDRPWKTIQYATQQILNGAERAAAKRLLEINRSFIKHDAVEFVDHGIANNTSPYTGSFTYTKATWMQFVGRLVDALVYDLSHGGNIRTRALTTAIHADATITGKTSEFNAMVDRVLVVADAVLSNVAPAQNYQTLNSNTTATQQTEAAQVELADDLSTATTLAGILKSAVTAGNTTNMASAVTPTNSLYVKSGSYAETLPILVPENTAVIGDELRSTKITPAGVQTQATDVPKSIAAIQRLKAIMSDIVTNGSVTKSSGNAENQVTSRPAGSSAAGTASIALFQELEDYIDYRVNGASGDSTVPTTRGTNTPTYDTGYRYAVEAIEANRAFLIAEVHAYIAVTYPSYTYTIAACTRDVNRYIDAIKYDLVYTGNWKIINAALLYANSASGSNTENMFLMRNATGLRNCTVSGLTGTLGSANAYGTKRPTAGAFVSLDPGYGPADTDAWISNRSPYVQNVTTFGTKCIGLKIDGDIHDGGNDSIVANDFTQILDEGIGAWVTNLGRAELVSVFSYYAHIGYLAENGGKIRATNGNSSYGDFGTVAEGVDSTETPTTGTVTNQSTEANIKNVLTDKNQILSFEYTNAGVNYADGDTTTTIVGGNNDAAISAENVFNGGVYEVRLTDPSNNLGGAGYVTATNTAQAGTATQITISNTDSNGNAVYAGMAIWIISGTGAGQYAYIDAYNSGTKVATVLKNSDGTSGWDSVHGASIESTLDATTEYIIEPRAVFSGGGVSAYADIAKARVKVDDGKISEVRIWHPGTGYSSTPTFALTDPNNTVDVPHAVRTGNGVIGQPTFSSRGTGYTTATATVASANGYADFYQPGEYVKVDALTTIPVAGSNVEIAGISGKWYKLVGVTQVTGSSPNYSALLQVSPSITVTEAPEHNEAITIRRRYSQVRLTGHDFLDVGTGGTTSTNYPGTPSTPADQTDETKDYGGGRVFYTSTDQDGNFRVGELFSVEQSTGRATLNADAFNVSGLQELQLGEISLGGTSATISEFSTDGTFTANSDSIVPTQRAIKTYIASQIGGGSGELNVNSVTAGIIKVSGQEITTTTTAQINIQRKVNFTGGISGAPVALNYFLSS